ncbi:Uncharacterised protein [Bordetella pertussis]|nr:Uncharacterised protein [Bordetella pertussis]
MDGWPGCSTTTPTSLRRPNGTITRAPSGNGAALR